MKIFEGKSVSHVKGFKASAASAGLRYSRKDMGMVYSEVPAVAAAVFTQNIVKAAPVLVDMEHIQNETTRAMVMNSANANACTGEQGILDARETAKKAAELLSIDEREVLVYSTGVIGQLLPMEKILQGVADCANTLQSDWEDDVQKAIMTTDTTEKIRFGQIELGGKTVNLCGIAKGSGMIHPNMATMLSYVFTDANITKEMLMKMHKSCIDETFNMVTVDGDTSTNDTASIMANGCAENPLIDTENEDYQVLRAAVYEINEYLSKAIAADGEGASKLIEVDLQGASDVKSARNIAKAIVSSSLVKSAIYGADANWGRILCAMGYSGSEFDQHKVNVGFENEKGRVEVFQNGAPIEFDEALAKEILGEKEVKIMITMKDGEASAKAWGCDLTEKYVYINASYRS